MGDFGSISFSRPIKLSVPAYLLRGLAGSEGDGQRPNEVPASVGTRFYDAEVLTMANAAPVQDVQSWMYPLDNTPAMDFLLPSPSTNPTGPGCAVNGGGSIAGTEGGDAKFTVGAHANLKGNNALKDKGANVDFHSTVLTSLSCASDGKTATIKGAGKDGNNDVTFTITVVDNGDGAKDTYGISLSNGYANSATLSKGNVQAHS